MFYYLNSNVKNFEGEKNTSINCFCQEESDFKVGVWGDLLFNNMDRASMCTSRKPNVIQVISSLLCRPVSIALLCAPLSMSNE